jgi:glycosyltransferase involved in cell wall biosynthesis
MSSREPLISCLCVTQRKPELLGRAIDCFLGQTYPNKELVILYEDDDAATEALLAGGFARESGIRVFRVPAYPKITLGELRNLAVRIARGEFICQWDDDDWYHIRRLEVQYEKLFQEGRHGSIMTQRLVFDVHTTTAYVSNERLWEGSILCKKSVLQLKAYEDKALGEDTATIEYLDHMGCLHQLHAMPWLYIYIYHGNNSGDQAHWSQIFRCSTALSPEDSKSVASILQGGMSAGKASLLLDEILAPVMRSIGETKTI